MHLTAVLATFGFPTVATWAGVAGVALILLYRIVTDRSAFRDLKHEVDELRAHVEDLDHKYQVERSMKHKSRNDVARTVMALELVRRLGKDCTCGVLDPLMEIIDRLFAELETVHTAAVHQWPPLEETE